MDIAYFSHVPSLSLKDVTHVTHMQSTSFSFKPSHTPYERPRQRPAANLWGLGGLGL